MPCRVVGLLITCALGLLAAPFVVEAQPSGQGHRIGFRWHSSPSLTPHLLEAFRHGLSERGYVEGEHFTIEHRYAEGNAALLPGLTAELVGLRVEVIGTSGAQAIQAVKDATSTMPVVMAVSGAPVETGFVTSLARPDGNLTGLSLFAPELSGKRLELLKDTVPALSHVAVLANPANPVPLRSCDRRGSRPRHCRCTWWRCAAHRRWPAPLPLSAVGVLTRASCSRIRCLLPSARVWSR